jgi:hypothetical protein
MPSYNAIQILHICICKLHEEAPVTEPGYLRLCQNMVEYLVIGCHYCYQPCLAELFLTGPVRSNITSPSEVRALPLGIAGRM